MATDADFFERNAEFFEDGIWEDDDTVKDVMALIVLHDVPIEVGSLALVVPSRQLSAPS